MPAEDQLLAKDMLAAGFAKTYHPGAAVVHSHGNPPAALLRRSFDEWRAQGKGIAFAETREYVDSVLKTRDIYAHAYRQELGLD